MSDDHTKDEGEHVEDAAAMGEDVAESPAAQELKDAFQTIGKGLGRLFAAIGSAVRDPALQEKAKATGTSVVDAVGDTLNTVADQVKEVFQRTSESVETEIDLSVEDAHRELDDTEAVEEIRADLSEEE